MILKEIKNPLAHFQIIKLSNFQITKLESPAPSSATATGTTTTETTKATTRPTITTAVAKATTSPRKIRIATALCASSYI
jgi:hypothetical protein